MSEAATACSLSWRVRGGDLGLRRLPQKLVGAVEMTRVDLGLGLLDKFACLWIVRVQRRDLCLQSLVVGCGLGQRLSQLVLRDVRVFADDLK